MMMVFIYQMISNTNETKDRIIRDDREVIDVEFALYRIELDISQIYSPLFHSGLKAVDSSLYEEGNQTLDYQDQNENQFQPSEKFPMMTARGHLVPSIDSPEKSEFIFLTASNRRKIQDSKQSRYAWVRYSLESMEKNDEEKLREEELNIQFGEYSLIRQVVSENIYTPEHEWEKIRQQVLLKSVKSLTFEFWSEETKKFVSSPRELNDKKNAMRMIKVKLVHINNLGNEVELERMFRVSWPYFDPNRDIEAVKTTKNNQRNTGGNNDGNN